ncbi:MAG: HsdR family type I site-specific deoxyribonuclease [Candidatus Bathyarchaeota archaeon]|nr:HsdR family type I site-specific deoxyribonuclease [Candidatus Bathyarchaeota archaeon]
MPLFSEKSLIEDYFVEQLVERSGKRWKFVAADELEREATEEPLLTAAFIRALKRLNADICIGDDEVKQVLNELKLRGSGSEDAKKILNYLKDGVPVKFEKERVVKYVKLFDYDKVAANDFVVSRQITHQAADKQIRNDIILYVNGIPLVNIECKNPASLTETWYNAFMQILGYERDVPELYKYIQLGVASDNKAKYFTTQPWQQNGEPRYYEWRDAGKDSIDSTIQMLMPETLLNIIRNYLFIRIERGATTKVVTRYMQYRAAEQISNRVLGNIEGKTDKTKGLVWHWQGSGKTLTMIFAANKLYRHPTLANPTVFFVVDREELEGQLSDEFNALDITKPEVVDSIHALRRIIQHDEYRGKRGIFITLIHKFRPEELAELQKELDTLSKTRETIQNRKNVILFIDEAHRTQYGTLAAQMKEILKNAQPYAFTGTPVAKQGHDTYGEFSYPPDEKYLDKYFMTDSIEDGFTLKIAYQPRLEEDVHLKKDMLEAFLEVNIEEIPENLQDVVEEKAKQKLNIAKVYLENPDRIKKVAQDIAEHFKENLDGRFKAIVVAVNRLSCVRYKRELDKLLPKEASEVVMTYNPLKDPKEIQDYLKEEISRNHGKDIEDIRKETITRFKEEQNPKILVVTDMLLTGFDAPILQTMYLDKPLKEHRLLQAIARTNRPFKDLKEAGLIIDYVGILKEFTRAFENYTKEDISGILINTDDLVKEFTQKLDETTQLFADVPKDQYDRETMNKAFQTITTSEEATKKFQANYKRLRKLFELLGPHPIKLEKLKDYAWLTQIYNFYLHETRQDLAKENALAYKYFQKTLKYVYKSTDVKGIDEQYPQIEFDANYLKNLQEKLKTKEEKAANILFTLNRFVKVDEQRNPIYEDLADKVERLLKLWKEKTKNFEKIYNDSAEIFQQIQARQARQKQLQFTNMQYAILLDMEKTIPNPGDLTKDTQELATQLQPYLFKGWQYQQTAKKAVESTTRRYLRKYIRQNNLSLADLETLYQKIIDSVKSYA